MNETVDASKTIEQITTKIVDTNKIFEQNASKTIKAGTEKYFLACIDNLLSELIQMSTPLGESITRNCITDTE